MIDIFKIIQKSFVRLRTAAMNPFRRIVRRVQQLFNVNLITAKLITPINKKIRSILNVKPKDKSDYISLGIFWISKKLIYFLILAACAGVFIYFSWFAPPIEDTVASSNVLTTVYYDYDDLELAEFSGKANIRGANGTVVYTGDIAQGICTGVGTLWNQDGVLVYEGSFENNEFSGNGTLYYPDKKVKYKGSFANNVYSGSGISYYQDGTMEYEGEFKNGTFSGEGIQYDTTGIMIYAGNFENGSYNGAGASYYTNGVKKYEGEFFFGHEQGAGTLYSSTGKKLFSGQFIRGQIQYEALLDCSMEEIFTMCTETPKIYYTNNSTTFLFEGIGLAVETDCIVELKKDEARTSNGEDWYLPGSGEDELLQEAGDDTVAVDYPDSMASNETADGTADGTAGEKNNGEDNSQEKTESDGGVDLPVISTAGKYTAYYYLASNEWQKEADLDYSQIQVTSLAVLNPELSIDFLQDEICTYNNGEADLLECVIIDQLRQEEPTLFSNIQFTQTTKDNRYIQITGIDHGQAIYTETYEVDNVRYRLCHEVDDYKTWRFITMETY